MDVIKNCLITNSDAKVLKEYCVDKTNPLYQKYRGFNTSLNLSASKVYNLYYGRVVMITGSSRFMYEVVVKLNDHQAIKYGNLKSVSVSQGQDADIGSEIGTANKYVAVEYMSTYVKNQYSFRINSIQMYKDDPAKLFDDSLHIIESQPVSYFSQSGLREVVSEYDGGIYDSSIFILSDNRGR